MKKIVLTIFLAVMACGAQAQWSLGASAGGDYNWYSINTQYQNDYHYEGAWGWSAAVFTQYQFKPWVALRAEVEGASKNYRFARSGMYKGTHYNYYNTYVQLPVMAKFMFGSEKVHGFVNVGVYAGYWASSQMKGQIWNYLADNIEKVDQAYEFNKSKDQRADFGLAGGLGLEWKLAEHWAMHVEARCYYSFISTVKQYMDIKDYRYNTTIGLQAGFSYIF